MSGAQSCRLELLTCHCVILIEPCPATQAEHFLYFENQYWLGGSGEWQSLETANICRHLVPIEIALKVSERILEGQHFAAYCVIPLFPEGECCVGSPSLLCANLQTHNYALALLVAVAIACACAVSIIYQLWCVLCQVHQRAGRCRRSCTFRHRPFA